MLPIVRNPVWSDRLDPAYYVALLFIIKIFFQMARALNHRCFLITIAFAATSALKYRRIQPHPFKV